MLEKITINQTDTDWEKAVGRVLAVDIHRRGVSTHIWGERIVLRAGTRLTDENLWLLYSEMSRGRVAEFLVMNSPAENATARREF